MSFGHSLETALDCSISQRTHLHSRAFDFIHSLTLIDPASQNILFHLEFQATICS